MFSDDDASRSDHTHRPFRLQDSNGNEMLGVETRPVVNALRLHMALYQSIETEQQRFMQCQ